jgi:hypothetical protein
LQTAFGLKNAILLCAVLFAAAFVVASRVDERRGARAAAEVR